MSTNPKGGGGPRHGDPNAPPPGSEPPFDRAFVRHQLQILAWIRVGLGALSGFIAGILPFNTNPGLSFSSNSYADIYIAVFIYIPSYYLAKYGMGIHLPYKDRNKLITQGIGGFIMMFLFIWFLYSTYCFSVHYSCPSFVL